MKNKIKILITITLVCTIFLPLKVLAYDISDGKICSGCSSSAYYTNKYQNSGAYKSRNIQNMNGFKQGGQRLFCVEPTKLHGTSGYSRTDDYSTAKNALDSQWKAGFSHQDDLKKVLSCWSDNNSSIVATQAVIWEIISEERYSIDANKILNGNYTPYMSDGQTFRSKTGKNPISGILCPNGVNSDTSSLCKAYQATLRCAARFNIVPSFSSTSLSSAQSKAYELTSYDDETQTFSRTFKHSGLDAKLLRYYNIPQVSGLKITKTDTSVTISTTNEIAKSSAKRITLNYAKKDNGEALNDDLDYFYYKNERQTLMQGSTTQTAYMYVYTGKKPTYQLRVQKKDEDGKPMKGVKFNVYSDAGLKTKIGTTTASDKNGWATLTGIKKIGKYYVQEAETPDGYKTNKEIVNVTVKGEHRTGSNKWPSASSVFTNKFMHLNLSKRTIDETGKEIDISDYTGKSCTGNYVGPVFTIKKDNKYVCVTPIAGKPGKYKLASSCDATGATNEIKTCDGKFDIEAIKSGCYDITETTAPDGYTLPQNPTQKVCVTKGQSATATVMYNGVSGVIFNKVTENGNPIDGGKFALQQKVNGVYRDMLLKHDTGAIYVYEANLKESDEKASYVLETSNGTINVKNLPPGEYRFVEKEAPEGYDAISDKDSKATFTISDKGIFGSDGKPATDYYQVKMVNQQTRVEGSYDSAELIVTIITGRKVINYALVIVGLAALLIALIILRKRFKK